jgi:hypothetical protein
MVAEDRHQRQQRVWLASLWQNASLDATLCTREVNRHVRSLETHRIGERECRIKMAARTTSREQHAAHAGLRSA